MKLASQKELFEIPANILYLNCAYMSPLLKEARLAGEKAIQRKSTPWTIKAEDFFTDAELVRVAIAELIHASPEQIALIPSASYGIATAAANIDLQKHENIVLLAEQFPSNVYCWRELAGSVGAEIVTVPKPSDFDWTSAVLQAINKNTKVVAVPNCHWTDGGWIDIVKVGKRAREVGAVFVIDATQSLGAVPLNVTQVNPDFLVASAYKWLLGPYSVAYLYVSPKYHMGKPLEYNWIVRKGSEDFSRLVDYQDSYQEGARRFDAGGRSNFTLLPMCLVTLRQILHWGVENIYASLEDLTALIATQAHELGLVVAPSEFRARHMIGISIPKGIPAGLSVELARQGIYVSIRGSAIRISPHLYNSAQEITKFFQILKRFI